MINSDKIIHDLSMLYAFANYLDAKREHPEIFGKHDVPYETDFIHSQYMEALREYLNYDDDCFDVEAFFRE